MRKLSVLAAIPLLFTGAQAQLTGSLGIAENACVLPIATFLFQNCGYSGGANISADLGGGNVWIGPLNLGGFYSSIAAAPGFTLSTQTGFDDNGVPLTSFLIGLQSSPGDGKVAPTMTSNISVVGSVVSGSFTIGAGAHLVSTGPALAGIKQAIEIWTSITHVLTAKLADNVIPGNAFGGSDYIIGSTGFPPTLCTATDCFASEMAARSGLPANISPWSVAQGGTGPQSTSFATNGIDIVSYDLGGPVGAPANIGTTTNATINPAGYSCVDTGLDPKEPGSPADTRTDCQDSPVVWGSNKVDPVRGDGSSNASFDNLILKVSTDSDDNVVEVSGFYVVQYDIIQAVYNSWAGGTLSFTGSSSSGEIDITGTQSVVDGACLAPLPFFNGEDCSYNESNPTTFGTHWLGPVATGGYYQVGQSPFALGSTSDTPQIGDNKYAVPLLPGSFIRIEDNGTACDTDDQISGSISLGAATRAFAGGPGTWGEETWGDGDIVFPIPATQVDAATPNGAGGCDYEIASAGFPPLLQSTKGGTYIFDTDIVESPPGPAPEDSWVASSPVGVACVTEGNCGVSVAVTVGPGWSCTENFAGACDMGPDGGSHFGGTRGTLENFLIAVSTNGNGEITAGTIFANNESKVFNVPPDPYNSWDGPMLNFTGTSVSGCTMVSAIDDSFTFINDGAPRDFDVLVNDECKDDPPISIVSLPGDLIPDQGGSAITDGERVTYTPPGGFAGPESFTYTAQDAGLAGGQEPPAVDQDTATVTVTLIEDLIPEAVDDEAEILQDQTVFIDVLANDILGNPDNVVSIETAPDNGSAFVQANNTIRYFPNFMFFGPDSFEYRLTDANGDTDVATVNVGVFFVSGRVPIDIMPGHEINNINLQAGGRIQVAILSVGEFFDAPATVDPFSLKFGPREANIIGTPQVRDIDRDGDDDLLVKFLIEQTGIPCGVTRTQLIGGTFTGGFIFGDDSVNTFQCRRRPISY